MYAKGFMHRLQIPANRAPMLFLLHPYQSIGALLFYYGKILEHAHPVTILIARIETPETGARILFTFKAIGILFQTGFDRAAKTCLAAASDTAATAWKPHTLIGLA